MVMSNPAKTAACVPTVTENKKSENVNGGSKTAVPGADRLTKVFMVKIELFLFQCRCLLFQGTLKLKLIGS